LDMWWRIAYEFPEIGYICEPLAILHIEVQDDYSTRLRIENKKGTDIQNLLIKHLDLAKNYSVDEDYFSYIGKIAKKALQSAIFNGHKKPAREFISKLDFLFSPYWKFLAYFLTIAPATTSKGLRFLVYLYDKFGFGKDISRRWMTLKTVDDKADED